MALITDLTIKNYRCFEDSDPVRFTLRPGFTGLIGKNNSGKSTLLRFLYEFRGLFESLREINQAAGAMTTLQTFGLPSTTPSPLPLYCDRNERPLQISMRLQDDRWRMDAIPTRLEITLPRTNQYSLRLALPDGTLTSGQPQVDQREGRQFLSLGGTTFEWFNVMDAFRTLANTMYLPSFRNAINVGATEGFYDIQVGQAFVRQWRNRQGGTDKTASESLLRLVDDIKNIFGFSSLQVNPSEDDRTLYVFVDGKRYSLSEMGSGLAQFIIILANVAIRRPSYLLIDEPELNLHASLQSDLLNTLAWHCSDGVVFATHNLGLARTQASHIYAVTRPANGAPHVEPFSHTGRLSEMVGSLSFAQTPELGFNRILLVEGKTDPVVFQQFLRLKGKEHEVLTLPLFGNTLINGQTHTEEQLSELKRITPAIFAVIDSEKPSAGATISTKRSDFKALCSKLNIKCHILDRRAIENYFPVAVIQKLFGSAPSAIGPFDPRVLPFSKELNWLVARDVTQ